jgi:hypothetical protein
MKFNKGGPSSFSYVIVIDDMRLASMGRAGQADFFEIENLVLYRRGARKERILKTHSTPYPVPCTLYLLALES